MVAEAIAVETPNLIPVPPDWLQRESERRPANPNRNLNDCYWQKGPKESDPGWVIVGPSAVPGPDGRPLTRQAESWMRRGRVPLTEYSYTNRVSPKTGQRDTIETNADRLTTPDRYYWLFANGGARFFPIEQIVEHHWHLTPPYGLSTSVFPQLQEWDVPEPYWCPACAGSKPPKNSEGQVEQHLMIEHRMTLVQVRDLQQQTDGFRQQPSRASGLAIRRKAQRIETAAEEMAAAPSPDLPKAKLTICNSCGEAIKGKLADHNCANSTAPRVEQET